MKIVLFRIDKIGDLIVSTPVVAAIRAKHPQAKIMLVASPYNAVVADGLKEVDEVVLLSETSSRTEQKEVIQKIRAFAPTHALVLSPKHNCYMASLACGAKHKGWIVMEYRPLARLGARILLPKHAIEEIPRSKRTLHHSQHILNLAARMGLCDAGEYSYLIGKNETATTKMKAALAEKGIGAFVAVHLVDKWLDEEWVADDVKRFLEAVQKQTSLPVVATAGPADKKLSEALSGSFPLFQGLSFPEWVALLGQARIIITPDCSAVHIACALKKPLLALYQSGRFARAVTEYGPKATLYSVKALVVPEKDIPDFLSTLSSLLKEST